MVSALRSAFALGRSAGNCVLIFLGAALIIIAANGTVRLYLAPYMRCPVLVAGLAVLGLAAADTLSSVARRSRAGDTDNSQEHSHDPGLLPWLLLVPGALLLFVVPGPIGASADEHYTVRDGGMYSTPLADGAAPEISIQELWVRSERTEDHSLDGREVTLTGQLLDDGGRSRIGRVVITCCAADAKTISAGIDAGSERLADGLRPGVWVRAVVSESDEDSDPDDPSPTVTLHEIEKIDPPDSPYETPH